MSNLNRDPKEYIEEVLHPMSLEDCEKVYREWSESYEQDMDKCQYTGYKGTAECFAALGLPKDARILDCGAGTGLLGVEMVKLGYTNLDALDGCNKMLEKATEKKIYKNFVVSFVIPDEPLPIEEGVYDALVMSGVWSPGAFPMKIGTFKQMLRVLKKGGIMTWGMNDPDRYGERDETFANKAFQKIMDALEEEGAMKILDGYPKKYPNHRNGREGFFYAVRKL